VSEFDNLKNDAEQYAQQHPDQVKAAESDVEKKFGLGQQAQGGGQQDQYGQDGPQDQGQQDQYGSDQQSGY
jgi:hypothetical protein